jgi:3'(2'), 5'-bisphosphate nucleotidase
MMEYTQLLEIAKKATLAGGEAIMNIYSTADFGVEMKADDSPLTLADKAAHEAIVKRLKETKLPILSEEGKDIAYETRKNWDLFWMVDPLDGTKEFIKRNGEFTVNIALIENNEPVLGIVYSPVLDKLYVGGTAVGYAKMVHEGKEVDLASSSMDNIDNLKKRPGIRIVASRSHRNQETDDFIKECYQPKIVSMGSSLKFMVLAESNADIYPRFAPTMEWDTAAADGVLRGLGYNVFQVHNNQPTDVSLAYNKQDLLNPHFIAY